MNFYFMLINTFKKTMLLPLILFAGKNIQMAASNESIEVSGNITMTELDEKIPVNLKMIEGHPYAYVNVYIYVNGVLEVSKKEITKYLSKEPYYIQGFKSANEEKKIKIEVNYVENNVAASTCNFLFYGPRYETYKSLNRNVFTIKDNNPIKINFKMKGTSFSLDKQYESITISSRIFQNLENTRYMNLDIFSISLTNIHQKLEIGEFRIYTKFNNSDLLYKDNSYTSIDVALFQSSTNEFKVENEYRFYVNEKTGMIQESQTKDCADEMLPFFIPLSLGVNVSFPIELHLMDIGKNHNDYIYTATLKVSSSLNINEKPFGSILNYQYKYIEVPLSGVEYA